MAPDPVDRLYDLPPAEFTPARDALAKKLRAAGDREAATAVKALRKPSAAAWAVNRAAREHPDAVRALLEAGQALRDAQEALLSGNGDRDALRRAAEGERRAVRAMVEAARGAGEPLSAAVEARVRETLHAAVLDEDVRAALAEGRLEREADAAGFRAALTAGVTEAPKTPKTPTKAEARGNAARAGKAKAGSTRATTGSATKKDGPVKPKKGGSPATRKPGKRAAAEARRRGQEEARLALVEAKRAARGAEREAEAAAKRLEIARAATGRAREHLEEAEADEAHELARCEAARKALREAKAAAAGAQSAADAVA